MSVLLGYVIYVAARPTDQSSNIDGQDEEAKIEQLRVEQSHAATELAEKFCQLCMHRCQQAVENRRFGRPETDPGIDWKIGLRSIPMENLAVMISFGPLFGAG